MLMAQTGTYPPRSIGCIMRATHEQRTRELDRWVALRTLNASPRAPLTLSDESAAPPAHSTRALLHDIDRRHAEARRKTDR